MSPDDSFWEIFPFHPLPNVNDTNTQIDVDGLDREYKELYDRLDIMQKHNIERTLNTMRYGADALIDEDLITVLQDDNSKSVLQPDVAQFYTDQLVTMVNNGFVSGPYEENEVPIKNLRIKNYMYEHFC